MPARRAGSDETAVEALLKVELERRAAKARAAQEQPAQAAEDEPEEAPTSFNFVPHSTLDLTPESVVASLVDAVDLEIGLSTDGGRLRIVPWPYAVANNIPLPCWALATGNPDHWIYERRGGRPTALYAEVSWGEIEIRLARARYLAYKGDLHRLFPTLGYVSKGTAADWYFDGVVPFASGPAHHLMWTHNNRYKRGKR